jgi:hypothetical protein
MEIKYVTQVDGTIYRVERLVGEYIDSVRISSGPGGAEVHIPLSVFVQAYAALFPRGEVSVMDRSAAAEDAAEEVVALYRDGKIPGVLGLSEGDVFDVAEFGALVGIRYGLGM